MKAIDPNSRTQRILRFIGANTKSVTHEDIVSAVRADPSDAKTKDLGNKVSATLCGLVDVGKVKRTGVKFAYRYERTPTTLQKSSAKQASAPAKAKATRESTAPAPKPGIVERERIANVRRPGEFRVVDKPAPFVVPNAALTPPRGGALSSEQIAADIAAFQKKGGRIQRCAPGERGQQFFGYHQAAANAKKAARSTTKRKTADNDDTLDADDLVDVA